MRSLAPIAAVQLVGNALLLWLGYYWLGLGETRAATLAWSALVALLLLTLACWLHGATFAYFSGTRRLPLRRLPLLVAAAIVLLAVYWALAQWADYSSQPAFKIASYLTLTFRKPVKPATVLKVFNYALWLVRWMVVPALALPILCGIATPAARPPATEPPATEPPATVLPATEHPTEPPATQPPATQPHPAEPPATEPHPTEPRPSGSGRRHARNWWYWIATPILLLCALWLPLKLMGWTPHAATFSMQMFSFVVRLLIAYLLFVGAWLALVFLTSGGSPRATQSSTVASP